MILISFPVRWETIKLRYREWFIRLIKHRILVLVSPFLFPYFLFFSFLFLFFFFFFFDFFLIGFNTSSLWRMENKNKKRGWISVTRVPFSFLVSFCGEDRSWWSRQNTELLAPRYLSRSRLICIVDFDADRAIRSRYLLTVVRGSWTESSRCGASTTPGLSQSSSSAGGPRKNNVINQPVFGSC